MLYQSEFKCYNPRMVHGILDDTDRRLQFYELFLNKCQYSPDIVMKKNMALNKLVQSAIFLFGILG